MPPLFTLRDPGFEFRLVRGRVIIAGVLMLLLFLGVIGRISRLQIVQHDHFATLSQHNRVKILPITPMRGLIFSRDNVLLADNRPAFSLELVPEDIEDMERVIADLRQIIHIDDADLDRFHEQLAKKRTFENIPLRFNLSDEEVARVSLDRHRFPGVSVVARMNRYYPLGANIVHTIGYVGMIDEKDMETLDKSNYSGTSHIGKIGVEKAYEELLHGQVGYQQVEVNAEGRIIRILERTPPVPGRNLHLTLDVSLQNMAAQALSGRRGAIVAIDPRDGSVLALVSAPGYDPNPFVNGIDARTYRGLLASKGTPLVNRVLQGKYPPGSTIKPFLAFAALNYGARDVSKTTWCPGWYSLKGSEHRYRDWKKQGHGHVGLAAAVAQSCDVYFYSLAHDLGIDRMSEALSRFGFGTPTGVDIGGEAAGLVPSREWKRRALGQAWYPGETLILGIGQGSALATPMQLANATAALANHGRLLSPHLLSEARDPISDQTVMHNRPVAARTIDVTDTEIWDTVTQAMVDVMHGAAGTARRSGADATYTIAGKTGTAQVIGIGQDERYRVEEVPEQLRDHALFIAFAPVDAPRIAVAILVENAGSGSANAAPIARRLFDHYLLRNAPAG